MSNFKSRAPPVGLNNPPIAGVHQHSCYMNGTMQLLLNMSGLQESLRETWLQMSAKQKSIAQRSNCVIYLLIQFAADYEHVRNHADRTALGATGEAWTPREPDLLDTAVYLFKQHVPDGNFWDDTPKEPVELLHALFAGLKSEMIAHGFPTHALDVLKFINKRTLICLNPAPKHCASTIQERTDTVERHMMEVSLQKLINYMPNHSGAYDGQLLFDTEFLRYGSGDRFLKCKCNADVNVMDSLLDMPGCTPGGPAYMIVNLRRLPNHLEGRHAVRRMLGNEREDDVYREASKMVYRVLLRDVRLPFFANISFNPAGAPTRYRLIGFVMFVPPEDVEFAGTDRAVMWHRSSGHYIAYVNRPSGWYCVNDDECKLVTDEEVQRASGLHVTSSWEKVMDE